MKIPERFLPPVLLSVLFLSACSSQATPLQSNLQDASEQTQQGIQVGLQIGSGQSDQTESSTQFIQQTEQIISTQQFPVEPKKNFVVTVISPDFSQAQESPLRIQGKVSGVFFDEGVFPVILKDAHGKIIAQTLANSIGDWMMQAPVSFTAKLIFNVPTPQQGTLIFQKSNESGLQDNDYSQSFSVQLQ